MKSIFICLLLSVSNFALANLECRVTQGVDKITVNITSTFIGTLAHVERINPLRSFGPYEMIVDIEEASEDVTFINSSEKFFLNVKKSNREHDFHLGHLVFDKLYTPIICYKTLD